MSDIPEEQLRFVKKSMMDDALTWIEDLMKRIYTSKTKKELFIKLRMDISLNLLGSEQLEKRIQAIRIIADTCKSAKESQELYNQSNLPIANDSIVLSSLFQVPQLIEEIFGKRSHIELIQRSTEILKFLLLNSQITQADFNVIWNCCTQDEQSKVAILKVISDSCNLLPVELFGFIIDKLVNIPKNEFKAEEFEIIFELIWNCSKFSLKLLKKLLNLMWKVAKGEITNLSPEVVEKTMAKFCDTITTPSKVPGDVTNKYFQKCYDMLKENRESILALRIMRRSMAQLPNNSQFASRNELLFQYLTEGEVFKNFFIDFEKYYEGARTRLKNGILNIQEHKEEILERKGFMIFLLKYTNYKLTGADFQFLWENLVQKFVIVEDQLTFYKFMRILFLLEIEDYVYSISEVMDFFSKTICNEDNNFSQLSIEGMSVINALLLFVNKHMEKIIEVGNKRKNYDCNYDYAYMTGALKENNNSDNFKDYTMDFRVKTLPTQIIGCSILWKIVLEAKSELVTIMAIEMINKIHTKLSEELDNRVGEISGQFVETAIEKLKLCWKKMTQDNINKSNEIVKLIKLIETMLDNSERKGNSGITPFVSLSKGIPLTLKIQTFSVHDAANNSQDNFNLVVNSKITAVSL